jgi:hypothetical protein
MKKFIIAMREFKRLNKNENLKAKICWFFDENKWFVSVCFSKKYIEAKGSEVCNG